MRTTIRLMPRAVPSCDERRLGKVTVKVFSGPRGGRLLGTRTVSLVNGVASFTGLSLKGAGVYTLEIMGSMLTTVVSDPITVTPVV